MADCQKYDSTFLSILQNEGQISNFLEAIFGFLHRRTDFYHVMKAPDEKLGFPPGVAAKIAYSAYKKFEDLATKEVNDPKSSTPANIPPAAVEMEVSQSAGEPIKPDKSKDLAKTETMQKEDVNSCQGKQSTSSTTKSDDSKAEETDDKDKVYTADSECYNGAARDTYSWSQSITDVDVRVYVPSHIQKGKQVTVDVTRKHLKVCIVDGGEKTVILDDDLSWEVHKDECIWSLVPGEHIHINLEKIQERWWESLLKDEEKINVRKIDASRPITDLDDEAQAKIQEMMYNEQQKRLGLPQSHEQGVQNMLKKAWNVEGSPFRGTPYDPSKVQIGSNSASGFG